MQVSYLHFYVIIGVINMLPCQALPAAAHLLKMLLMRRNGTLHGTMLDIRNLHINAYLPDDLADGWIMYMRYLREQVVLYLEIKPANPPGNKFIAHGEISCCF